MANAAAFIKESVWRDRDFRALPRLAQCTYLQLLSQKELDRAGVITLHVSKWVKGCDGLTEDDFWCDLGVLEDRRFVFVDRGTDELFIRSYMRHTDITRYPNIFKNALKCVAMVESEKLRHEVAVELRRLRQADAAAVADDIDPEPPPNPSRTSPSGSRTVPERSNRSETVPEPRKEGEGSVEGEGYLPSNSPRGEPPPQFCPKHPNGTDRNCWVCGERRKAREVWDTAREADGRAAAAHARQSAIDGCPLCDDRGLRDAGDGESLTRCGHPHASTARIGGDS